MAKKIFLSEDKKRLEFDEKEYLVKPIDISLEDLNYLIPAYVSVEGILHPYWRSSNNFGKLDTVNNKKADNKKNVNISLDDVLKIDAKTTISQTLSSNQPNAPHSGNRVETVDDNNNTYSVQNSFGFMAYDSIRRKIFTIGTFIGFEHKSYTDPLSYQGIKMISLSEYGHSRITATTVVDNKISGNIEFIFTAPVGVSATIHVPTKSGTLALISDITNSLVNYYTKTETVTNFIGVNNVQTINETKTFSKSPVVPNGTLGNHAVNKNQLDLKVDKTESNEVLPSFDFHQENGAYINVDVDGLKVSKGGIYSLYKSDSIKPYNQSIGAAYQFQELLFPKRAVIGVEEKVYPITYLNGVKANENGRADIWGVANNWTNASQRFSGLVDKSTDATFNSIIGSDSVGKLAKISQAANLLERTLAGTTSEQALRIGNLLNGGNGSSGAINVNLISPPLLQNTRNDIEYVLLRGANLLLNNTDMSISICDEGKSVIQRIPNEQIINNSTTELLFYYNFYQFTVGTYYLKITSGVKIYFTTLDLQIVDEIENIDINAITWDINYKEGVIPKNTDNASGGYVSITTLGPVTELPIQSLKSSPLFSKDDDFYIEFTLELGIKWLHVSRYLYFSFIGLGDSSIPNTLFNNSFIYLKYSHSWDYSNATYNNDSRISDIVTPSKITVNVIKTKGVCRMVIGSSNVNVIIPNMDYFSLFMAFTGNEYELLTQIKIIKAFKIK